MNDLKLLLCFLLVSCHQNNANKEQTSKDKKPNIIAILIDDAGYVDFGFMGSKDLETPNIDALAKDGVIFTDAHVTASVCAPSRAGLITGMYQQRFGFEANGTGDKHSGDIGLGDNVVTMADIFKENGYRTIALGKWHLGKEVSDHPNQRGFDEFYGFIAGSRSYFPIKNPSKTKMLQHNSKQVEFKGYLTDVLGNQSVKYVEDNKNHPFFMYLSYNAVHTPMEAKKDDLEKYKEHSRQKLAAMTWSLDENIGKLTSKLKELNLYDNTLIYFLSDNGGAANNTSNTGDLKGWKGNKFEGGHRVPFVISWPAKIKGNQKFDGLTSSLDIFPTSLAALEIEIPRGLGLDGVSLLPYLFKQKKGNPHKKLFWRKLEESAVRLEEYKLIKLQDYRSVLYNLDNDIGEMEDLKFKEEETFKMMQQELKNWESELMLPLWTESKDWREVTYYIHKQLMNNESALAKSPSQLKKIETLKKD